MGNIETNQNFQSIAKIKIEEAKKEGSGLKFRFTKDELLKLFSMEDTPENNREILHQCSFNIGDDFALIMPPEYAVLDFAVNREIASKIIIELVWSKIDQRRKVGSVIELTRKEVYDLFGYLDEKNIPVELLMFSNDIDTMDPNLKFVRHTAVGDVLYSTNEFNECYKFFTYSGLSHKTVATAWKKINDARNGNLVRFAKNEISYIEASDLFKHRTKSFNDTESAYSVEEFFNIMPSSLVKETSEDFDLTDSLRFYGKLIYLGDCCLKNTPYIVKSDKNIIKQNVEQFGAKAIEELITYIPESDNSALNEAKLADSFMNRANVGRLIFITGAEEDKTKAGTIAVKPEIFNDILFLASLFSVVSNAEKDADIAISIMKHSKLFCEDKNCVANAIGATVVAYNLADERILPDPLIVISMIKKYESEIKLNRPIEISKKLLSFSDSLACSEDNKLIIKALDEFSKIDNPNEELRNAMLNKIDQILLNKKS